MITRLRASLFIVLSALALAGSGVGAWALGDGGWDSTSSDGQLRGQSHVPTAAHGVDASDRLPAARVEIRLTGSRANGATGTGGSDLPAPRFAGTASRRLSALGPATWVSTSPSPGIAHASVLSRSGALSSFGTSLPPPPRA